MLTSARICKIYQQDSFIFIFFGSALIKLSLIRCHEFHDTIDDYQLWLEKIESRIRHCEPINLSADELVLKEKHLKLVVGFMLFIWLMLLFCYLVQLLKVRPLKVVTGTDTENVVLVLIFSLMCFHTKGWCGQCHCWLPFLPSFKRSHVSMSLTGLTGAPLGGVESPWKKSSLTASLLEHPEVLGSVFTNWCPLQLFHIAQSNVPWHCEGN